MQIETNNPSEKNKSFEHKLTYVIAIITAIAILVLAFLHILN